MTTKHYVATVHLLIALDDDDPRLGIDQAAACDVISEYLWDLKDCLKDWEYAETAVPVAGRHYALPIEVQIPVTYKEGDLYLHVPLTHSITSFGEESRPS